jgi:hypothetical protein
MNTARATVTGILIVVITILMGTGVPATPTPSASPTVNAPNPISVNPPPGWDRNMWAAARQECQRIWNKPDKQWSRAEFDVAIGCMRDATIQINPNLNASPVISASSPLPAPVPSSPIIGIPEVAPPSQRQEDWRSAMRARCVELSAKLTARQGMTREQLKSAGPLSSADLRDIEPCLSLVGQPPEPPPATSLPGQPLPTPSASPTANASNPISVNPPPGWGSKDVGGGASRVSAPVEQRKEAMD